MRGFSMIQAVLGLAMAFQIGAYSNEIPTPRAISPELSLNDIQTLNTFMAKLVEEYEGLVVNPRGGEADHLEIYFSKAPCKSAGENLSQCKINYQQFRWNGTLTTLIRIQNGKGVELVKASYDGFH